MFFSYVSLKSFLANDGIFSGSGVQLIISGLESGRHTLLAFHNTVHNPDNNTFPPIDIYVNDSLSYNNLIQTSRVTNNADAATAFFVFDVAEGENVVVFFTPDTNTDATSVEASLNGFELNTPNAICQASSPVPADKEEHVDADNDSLLLCWKAASRAISHDVYFNKDSSTVADADPDGAGDTMVRTIGIFIEESSSGTGTAIPSKYDVQGVFNAYCFPNPASGQVSLIIEIEKAQMTRIYITDIIGKVVFEEAWLMDPGMNIIQIDLRPHAPGIYNLFIKTETDYKSLLLIKN